MPAFRTNGSTGVAPITSYFGRVPDQFSAICAGIQDNMFGFHIPAAGASCKLVNQWQVYNPSNMGGTNVNTANFGGFITAPDGTTNTMQKLVEGTNNGIHAVTAMFFTAVTNSGGFKMRCSIFAKVAERTRFALYCADIRGIDLSLGGSGFVGAKTVFDVGGGQIGVANTAFGFTGTAFVPGPTEIVSFGGGVYRCTMDVTAGWSIGNQTIPAYQWGILLDNGAGTAAESTAYVGDGSSGMYFWKSTMLPPAAWSINNVTYFNDFLDLSKVDVNNTRLPGYDYYVNNTWPNPQFTLQAPTLAAKLSIVAGTQLKIAFPADGGVGINTLIALMSSATDGGAGHVLGQLFQPPALFECSNSWDGFTNPNNAGPTFWTTSIERLQDSTDSARLIENDFFEWQPGGASVFPGATQFYGPSGPGVIGREPAANGVPIWYSTYTYPNTYVVYRLGNLYQSVISPNLGNPPESSPSAWHSYTVPGATLSPLIPNQVDWTQQHLFSILYLNYSANDVGQILYFFDGDYCISPSSADGHFIYSPNAGPAFNPYYLGDSTHLPLMFGTSSTGNSYIDYIRVTQ